MERPSAGRVAITERARRILRPQQPDDELKALREAALSAPDIGGVYQRYRGENLPDAKFFKNALTDTFKIPEDKVDEFEVIFLETMQTAQAVGRARWQEALDRRCSGAQRNDRGRPITATRKRDRGKEQILVL